MKALFDRAVARTVRAATTLPRYALALALLPLPVAALAQAENSGCDTYEAPEQAVIDRFAAPSLPAPAGGEDGAPARLDTGTAYRATLMPQARMRFVAEPGRHTLADGAYATTLVFHTEQAGPYRAYIDDASWVDLVDDNGERVPSEDFGGRHDCRALRKFVAYTLEADHDYVLQLSGGTRQRVRVLVQPDHR